MPFSKTSPISIFTAKKPAVGEFLKEVYKHVCIIDEWIAVGDARAQSFAEKSNYSLSMSSEMLVVRQKLSMTQKEFWDSLTKSQQNLVNALLPTPFRGLWNRVFLQSIEEPDLYLVRQLYI